MSRISRKNLIYTLSKAKSMNEHSQMAWLVPINLKYLSTLRKPETSPEFENYSDTFHSENKVTPEFQNFRVPSNGCFNDASVKGFQENFFQERIKK